MKTAIRKVYKGGNNQLMCSLPKDIFEAGDYVIVTKFVAPKYEDEAIIKEVFMKTKKCPICEDRCKSESCNCICHKWRNENGKR